MRMLDPRTRRVKHVRLEGLEESSARLVIGRESWLASQVPFSRTHAFKMWQSGWVCRSKMSWNRHLLARYTAASTILSRYSMESFHVVFETAEERSQIVFYPPPLSALNLA